MRRFAIIADGKRVGTATFAYMWGMFHIHIDGFKPDVLDDEREALDCITAIVGEYELEEV